LAGGSAEENYANGRFRRGGIEIVAKALDQAGFSLLDNLPKAIRDKLAKQNQENSRKAVKTFEQAVDTRQPLDLRRAVQRKLYRARERYLSDQRSPGGA
jgi:hypothetical protein